jgi:hypothetical protein
MIDQGANSCNCFWSWTKWESEIEDNIHKKGKTNRIEHHESILLWFIIFFIHSIEPKSDKHEHNEHYFNIGPDMDELYLQS